ncbi:MAG: hypothetical protein AAGK32_09150 [Actinomycetota bacterium]
MSWLFRPDQWPRTPQDWIERASRWPTTPRQWLAVVDELSRAPTRVLVDLIESLSAGLVGRSLRIETEHDTISLRLVDVVCSHDNPPVAMGALSPGLDIEAIERVVATATDVRWDRGSLDDLVVEAHDLRLEPGVATRLVAAPVYLEGRIGQSTVDEWVERLNESTDAGLVGVELGEPDTVAVRLRPWLVADVAVRVEDREIVLPVRRLRAWGVTIPFAHRRIPDRRVPVPDLAQGLRLTDIEIREDEVVAYGTIDRIREPIWMDQLVRAASSVGSSAVLRMQPPADDAAG